jgi:hypothetical protein
MLPSQGLKWKPRHIEINGPRFAFSISRIILPLIIGNFLVVSQPWSSMKSTLLWDVASAVSSVLIGKGVRTIQAGCTTGSLGSNPMGSFNYNPVDDRYYISNLDEPMDEFIAEALEGVKINNIVHLVLESMRGDSYPFQENSRLAEHIKSFPPLPGAREVSTANVSPFIASLAEHSLEWSTVWAVVPFTHKAMLGRIPPHFLSHSRLLRPSRSPRRLFRRMGIPSQNLPNLSPPSLPQHQHGNPLRR